MKEIDAKAITAEQKKLIKNLDKLSKMAYNAAIAILQDPEADIKIKADLITKVLTLQSENIDRSAKNNLAASIANVRAELQEKQLVRIGMKTITPEEDDGKPRVTFSPSVIQNIDGEDAATGDGVLDIDHLKNV
jgi:hypothetical protein